MELDKISIYRITHIENIPHILKYGITHKSSQYKNQVYKNIGDESLIGTRENRHVHIDNGELELRNCSSIVLGELTPFYFGVKMPMLYVIQKGGNFVETVTKAEDIIYIACSLSKIVSKGIEFYFTDGHATDMLTSFYDKTKTKELSNIIDWFAIKSSYWGGIENLNIKRKKQAEFLVKGDLSPDLIVGFGCYSENAKIKLTSLGISENQIKIIPKAYY